MVDIQTDLTLPEWNAEPNLNLHHKDHLVAEGEICGHYYHLIRKPFAKDTIIFELTIDGFHMYASSELSESQMKTRIKEIHKTGQICWPNGNGSLDLDKYIADLIERTAAEEEMLASHLNKMRGKQRQATIEFLEERGRTDLL